MAASSPRRGRPEDSVYTRDKKKAGTLDFSWIFRPLSDYKRARLAKATSQHIVTIVNHCTKKTENKNVLAIGYEQFSATFLDDS
jgi:hypothetical protein